MNDFDVQSVLQGQVSLAAVNQISVVYEAMNGCKNQKIHLRIASKMYICNDAHCLVKHFIVIVKV